MSNPLTARLSDKKRVSSNSFFSNSDKGIEEAITVDNKIRLLYAAKEESGNFGKLLSKYVVEDLSGKKVERYDKQDGRPHLDAIGSILGRDEICNAPYVWGSGFLSHTPSWKIWFVMLRQFFRGKYLPPKFFAVRGLRSWEILKKAGFDCPKVFGDPGLLLPALYFPRPVEKKYKVGVICHWKHHKIKDFLFTERNDVKYIAIEREYSDITSFIDELLSCDAIFSSSLHGLILANAYKVPAVRFTVCGASIHKKEEMQDFKFEDYLSGLRFQSDCPGVKYEFPIIQVKKDQIFDEKLMETILSIASVPPYQFNAGPLLNAFPLDLSRDIFSSKT